MASTDEVKVVSPVRDEKRASRHLVFTHYIDRYKSFYDFEGAVEEFGLDNPHNPLTKVLDVLKSHDDIQGHDLRRGDIVQLLPDTFKDSDGFGKETQFYDGRRYRNDWLLYYDGTHLRLLPGDIFDYGHIPDIFTVPDQFPTGYWIHAIDYHTYVEFLDPDLVKYIQRIDPQVGVLQFRNNIGANGEDAYPYWRVVVNRSDEKATYSETCECDKRSNSGHEVDLGDKCRCEEFYVIGMIDGFDTPYNKEIHLKLIREWSVSEVEENEDKSEIPQRKVVDAGEDDWDIGETPQGKAVYINATTISSVSGDGKAITIHYDNGTTRTERYNERHE